MRISFHRVSRSVLSIDRMSPPVIHSQSLRVYILPLQIGALTVFAIGIWTLVDSSYLEKFLGTDMYKSSASILVAMGVIVIVIAFLGCFGALKEAKCALLTVQYPHDNFNILSLRIRSAMTSMFPVSVFHRPFHHLRYPIGRRRSGLRVQRQGTLVKSRREDLAR